MAKTKKSAEQKRLEQRDHLWPHCENQIFDPSKRGGYARMPRIAPFVASFINTLDRVDAGPLYLVLWSHDFGQGFIEADPDTFMFEAGYLSARSRRTWQERIKVLESFGFVWTKPHGNREYGFILLRDPYLVFMELHKLDRIPSNWMDMFLTLCRKMSVDPEERYQEIQAPPDLAAGEAAPIVQTVPPLPPEGGVGAVPLGSAS